MKNDWAEFWCLLWLYIVQAAYIEAQWRQIEINSKLIIENELKLQVLRKERA